MKQNLIISLFVAGMLSVAYWQLGFEGEGGAGETLTAASLQSNDRSDSSKVNVDFNDNKSNQLPSVIALSSVEDAQKPS